MKVKIIIPESTKLGIAVGALMTYAACRNNSGDVKKTVKNAVGKIGKKLTDYAEK